MTTHLGFPLETVAVFVVLSVGAIAIDLFAHRSDKPMSLKSAALWSVFWIAVSLAFGGYLWFHHGSETASLFFTGYALEKVLSVDNLFVIMAVFSWFKIPEAYRHRVLYWGIIGAIVFRMVFVAIGTGLMALGPYVELVFAVVVGWTGVMMLRRDEEEEANEDCRQNPDVRLEPAGEDLKHPEQHHPQPVKKGALVATPLFLCLAIIEISDVMFAFDSVPAVIAVSKEPLIVYSAMMFAILGLRTMYFVLEALRGYLVHLEKAVVALLFFIAVKLALSASEHLFQHGYEISPNASLVVVLVVLALGVAASFVFPEKSKAEKQNKQP